MAKFKSPFKLSGTLSDSIYYENEFGQQVRSKGSPSKWHVEHAESYANARRNAEEWKQVTGSSQLLRFAIGGLYKGVMNARLSGRMNGVMIRLVRSDMLPEWGKRRASGGNPALLEGFEFNHKLELDDALPLNINNCYTVDGGKICLQVPAFRVRKKKGIPAKATHYRVVSALITVNFDGKKYVRDIQQSPLYVMGRQAGSAFTAEHVIAPSAIGSFWLVGVEFFASDEPGDKVLKGGALRIVQYIKPVQEEMVAGKEEREEVMDDRAAIVAVEAEAPAKETTLTKTPATTLCGQPIKEPIVQESGTVRKLPADGVAPSVVLLGWNGFSSMVTTSYGYSVQYTHRS